MQSQIGCAFSFEKAVLKDPGANETKVLEKYWPCITAECLPTHCLCEF